MADPYRVGSTVSQAVPQSTLPGAQSLGLGGITADPVSTPEYQVPLLRTAAPTWLYPTFGRDPDLGAANNNGAGGAGTTGVPGGDTSSTDGSGGAGSGAGIGTDTSGLLGLGGTGTTAAGDAASGIPGGTEGGMTPNPNNPGTGASGVAATSGNGDNYGTPQNTSNYGPTNLGLGGLSPGRQSTVGVAGTLAGLAIPGAGTIGALGNAVNGGIAGAQASDMTGQLIGPQSTMQTLGAIGRGATGMGTDPMLSLGQTMISMGMNPDEAATRVNNYAATGSMSPAPDTTGSPAAASDPQAQGSLSAGAPSADPGTGGIGNQPGGTGAGAPSADPGVGAGGPSTDPSEIADNPGASMGFPGQDQTQGPASQGPTAAGAPAGDTPSQGPATGGVNVGDYSQNTQGAADPVQAQTSAPSVDTTQADPTSAADMTQGQADAGIAATAGVAGAMSGVDDNSQMGANPDSTQFRYQHRRQCLVGCGNRCLRRIQQRRNRQQRQQRCWRRRPQRRQRRRLRQLRRKR